VVEVFLLILQLSKSSLIRWYGDKGWDKVTTEIKQSERSGDYKLDPLHIWDFNSFVRWHTFPLKATPVFEWRPT
jgi:hypothetical protein